MDEHADELVEAIAGELTLLDPEVRSTRSRMAELLDPAFEEVGASGRRWTRAQTLAEPLAGASDGGPRYTAGRMRGVVLAPGVVHLTYESTFDGRRVRRSSLWRRAEPAAPLRMYYHQGTPVPPGAG
ncbi:DUF4440 domain-containing protein [Actinophytocola sp.]|uniref:nuclear transport factor 2 family protein n=1 Tax=Actinophytocola sp. TaxID=1872138 RepID=UPI002D800765|nr:DUF4440 domain-containing protein [Actinophytocola sp.]HET9143871.1 DUF4440 domain-containing protein [Actinophytocola sp.]